MALKVYLINGATFQYEEGNQPDGAEEYAPESVKAKERPANKQAPQPKNK